MDETLSEGQRYDDNYLVFNGITLADDEYVSYILMTRFIMQEQRIHYPITYP